MFYFINRGMTMFISDENYQLMEQFIYLPLVIKILHQDYELIKKNPFKIKEPYLAIIDHARSLAEKDLLEVQQILKKQRMKVTKKGSNEAFSLYEFTINGKIQEHSFYHPVMKNKTRELLQHYMTNSK